VSESSYSGLDDSQLCDYPVRVITNRPEIFLCMLADAVVTDHVDARRSPM
jgi:hypothetical protein